MKVLVTGGTGFIGRPLCRRLIERGHQIWVVTRHPEAQPPQAGATFLSSDSSQWQRTIAEMEGLINLAGESIAAGRWSTRQKERIRESRVEVTRRLVETIAASPSKPSVLISASAIGYYGDRGEEVLEDTAPPGDDFLANVCQAWEAEAQRAEPLGVRVVRCRMGMVLGPGGGALAKMVPPFLWGIGGPLGSGRQWVSWIHQDDVIELLQWALASPRIAGALNATAPEPVRMRHFAATLGRVLHRPSWAPVPAFVLRGLLGEMAELLLLASQRVMPNAALQGGYAFRYPRLVEALEACFKTRESKDR